MVGGGVFLMWVFLCELVGFGLMMPLLCTNQLWQLTLACACVGLQYQKAK